ncbi:hypothetical protein Tco_1070376 [Tanacetum coccineum]|uniref:Transposase n=1 Tax=Tanacetum coccineum TaxID=301880 RepID=A0ABQ5HLH9_9ASTR
MHQHCKALKTVLEAGQSFVDRDGSIFVYNPDVLREQFVGLVIQQGLPFNHFDNAQMTRVFQNHMQLKYNHVELLIESISTDLECFDDDFATKAKQWFKDSLEGNSMTNLLNKLKENKHKGARNDRLTSSEYERYVDGDFISHLEPHEFAGFDVLGFWKAMDLIKIERIQHTSNLENALDFEEEILDEEVQENEATPLSDEEIALDQAASEARSNGSVEEVEDGSEGLLEWNKEKAKKGCEATAAEAGEDNQDAKEAMELMADGTSIDGIDVYGTRINDWECPKCGNGDFSFRLQNQPRVPVSLLDIAWTLYSVPSIFSVCIDLDRDSNDIRTMAEMSKAVLQAANKGKMTVLQPEIITLQDIRPTHTRKTIELWVYCKWIAKNVTTKERTNFCCMLLDRGTIRFGCTDTKKWRRTLDYKTTLNFGRYTRIEPIANDSFPEHYFNFVAYNEVQSKADVKDATLTGEELDVVENKLFHQSFNLENYIFWNRQGAITWIEQPHQEV